MRERDTWRAYLKGTQDVVKLRNYPLAELRLFQEEDPKWLISCLTTDLVIDELRQQA